MNLLIELAQLLISNMRKLLITLSIASAIFVGFFLFQFLFTEGAGFLGSTAGSSPLFSPLFGVIAIVVIIVSLIARWWHKGKDDRILKSIYKDLEEKRKQ